ncbi:MAG: ATP-binding protein [Actinobacteria bacterium]|nr:ATP-binding protein [Actinomycetota bacterium]
MVRRDYWIDRIERAWQRRSVVWLHGVRRVGKTTLCRSLDGVEYFDCDLLSVRERLRDPESFWSDQRGRRVVLDEIHHAPDPSLVLKTAADHFPETRVIATGSSTLAATAKFSDSLTGRKTDIWLTPMVSEDLAAFGGTLDRRLWQGGLPPFYLGEPDEIGADFFEWVSSYWARDVQELFRIQQRPAFVRFVELVLARSGGMFEATAFAEVCEVSRTTIQNYLEVLQVTGVASVLRPFSSRRTTEIVSAPKVYGFDTGFVRHASGWRDPRPEDWGTLWEHYVLNEIQAHCPDVELKYWRQKRGPEVDFVLERRGLPPMAIECKWRSSSARDLPGLRAFRAHYPEGEDLVVCSDLEGGQTRRLGERSITLVGVRGLLDALRRAG